MKISLPDQKIEWLNTWTIYMNISRAHLKWVRPNIIHQLILDTALKCSQSLWANLVIQMEKTGKICFRLESIKILAESINGLFKGLNEIGNYQSKTLNWIKVKTRDKVPCFETKHRVGNILPALQKWYEIEGLWTMFHIVAL